MNDDLQVIALTATAGVMVKRDVVNILRLKNENVISEEDFDRINFSYQIVTVKDHKDKDDKFKQILTEAIPNSLKKGISTILFLLIHRAKKNVGIIYTIYADPHGRQSIYDGIAHYLYETKKIVEPDIFQDRDDSDYELTDYGSDRIRAFSSKSPTLCHKCNSYKYISDVRREADNEYVEDSDDMDTDEIPKGQKKCLSCGHVFVQANNRDANRPPKYQKTP